MTKEKTQKIDASDSLKEKVKELTTDLKISQQFQNLRDEAFFRYQLLAKLDQITEELRNQAEATRELVTLSENESDESDDEDTDDEED